jgi:hypothetical protein
MLVSIALQLAPLFIGLLGIAAGITAGWFAGRASNR